MATAPEPFIKVPLDWKKLLPGKKRDVNRDMADLPYTEPELIQQCQKEYEEAAQHGGQEALDACFRLSWALVHSQVPGEVQRGIELAEALTDSAGLDQRDLLYLVAVGKYRQRRYIEARRTLKGLMQVHPEFRQAEGLLEACDREIVKDGLVGVGAGAAILGAVAAIAVAAMRK
ncbi:hypothetical protein CHLNCDRAFT_138900 [Chlorella variabilis]|uniref:Mitochondrial fission 1 protein n=1 Tax=Chlorella variabilis TaxID=554065 RepID=E1ZNW5_CHLVA|nr:hypothetical protein CHLNCDRAFT_138900 [Chlorella variabilis]EFN52415.1 hypothetical protein CHLNCDRAFT_138900 [Chlorella variabilis]|eukprot:XP_005844517.1 hypothetical protein CHLNCDRAFT_138900 [Chlorella variabilis]